MKADKNIVSAYIGFILQIKYKCQTKSKNLLLLQAHHSFGLLQNYSGFQEAHYMCYPKS